MKKLQRDFFLSVFIVVVLYVGISWVISDLYSFGEEQILAIILSGVLSVINIIISFVIFILSYDEDINGFMKKYFGGMGLRLLFLLLSIFLVLKLMRIDIFVFILSLFVLYFIFQSIEIYFIHNYQKRK